LGVASTAMDQKVGQATEPGARAWVSYLSRQSGLSFSFAPQSTMVYRSIFPPRTNSNLSLLRSEAASKIQSVVVRKGAAQHRGEACRDHFLSDFWVAASHVPAIPVPAEDEPKVSVECGSRRGMMPSCTLRALKRRDSWKRGGYVKNTR
jgi:hypothetical protein